MVHCRWDAILLTLHSFLCCYVADWRYYPGTRAFVFIQTEGLTSHFLVFIINKIFALLWFFNWILLFFLQFFHLFLFLSFASAPPGGTHRKMMLFPKALFLATTFPNIAKTIQFFYWILIKKFQNFLKISQQFMFFVQTREKLTQVS